MKLSWKPNGNHVPFFYIFSVRGNGTESTIIATIHCPDVGYCLFGISLVMHTPYHIPCTFPTSAKCKSGTTVLLVHHPAPWSPWSPWSTLIHLGPQFPECGYTKWSKQDQGGPGVVQGHRQDHGAGWWTRSVQDHRGPLKNFFLMYISM